MWSGFTRRLPPGYAKWAAYALLLIAPGSFISVPLLWLLKRYNAARSAV